MTGRIATAILLLLLVPATAAAQELRVFLVTVGPGELSYERYGHNALLFVDPEADDSVAFDWGRFDFDQPNFIGRFIKGDMLYSGGADDGDKTLAFYVATGRRVELQELNLTDDQAWALLEACDLAVRPENRDYPYDYFLDNCSTRVRDRLDDALGGQLKSSLAGLPTSATWREEAERHVSDRWPLWYGIHFGLGRPAGEEIDAWQQSFLPAKLRDWLRTVEVAGPDGQPASLVKREIVRSEGELPPVAETVPSRWWQLGLLGLALAGLMLLLARLPRRMPARLAVALWYLLAGFVGTFMIWVWAFSGHWAGHQNANILLVSPLGLPLSVMVMAGRWPRATVALATAHLLICLLGVLLHFVPGWGQQNLPVITVALPLNTAAWVAVVGLGNWRALAASNPTAGEPAGLQPAS